MTSNQIALIYGMLIASVAFLVIPALIAILRRIVAGAMGKKRRGSAGSRVLLFSACLLGAIWCLRYAVGYYSLLLVNGAEGGLTWWEEIFNSMAHALQTFSMDEDYTAYIINGKQMLRHLTGESAAWQWVYGLYASVLNFTAPVAGGAIVFEILASIFPRIKLRLSFLAVWREKYYFSQLNESSLALAKSVYLVSPAGLRRPVIIFANSGGDDGNEAGSEMLMEAKALGAICVRGDLAHVSKNRFGMRKFFLIDEQEAENLHTLTKLSGQDNGACLKKAELYLFTHDDAYVQIERRVRDKLRDDLGFTEEELPVFVPVQSYRNLISNLLVDVPLYEPLIHKKKKADGTVDLTVTILGAGSISTEMFLSTYWFGQILDCNLNINVVSQETEDEFWSKIDYVNPEIRRTTIEGDPTLRINRKGDFSPPYCKVRYIQCDARSSQFLDCLRDPAGEYSLLDTDYFLVAMGSDETNLTAANTVRKYVGEHHISTGSLRQTIIAYVIYNSELAQLLNRTRRFSFVNDKVDVFMCAVGSLQEVYSVENIFMTNHESMALKMDDYYLSMQNRAERAKTHRKRMADDYKHWANLARGMHTKYKAYSMGLCHASLFEFEGPEDEAYRAEGVAAVERYKKALSGDRVFSCEEERQEYIRLLHRLAWLEHRRWNAFTRVKGFRCTGDYHVYAHKGSYKQMDLKLHPCLVECDMVGIRGDMDEQGRIVEESLLKCTDRENFDLLDELTYDLYDKGWNQYDLKYYDYPAWDF